MTSTMSIDAEIREKSGKGIARALRRSAKVPAIIYNKNMQSLMVALPHKETQNLKNKFNFMTTVVELNLNGKIHKVLPKHMSLHPVNDLVEHVEFISLESNAAENIKVNVPIRIVGAERSAGMKRNAVLNMSKRYVECLAPHDEIPECINIDVSKINIGDVVKLKDLEVPASLKFKSKNLDQVILKMSGKKAIKVEEDSEPTESSESEETKA